MMGHKRLIFKIALLFASTAILLTTGCARKEPSERIVAVINDYKMTVEDFNYESNEVLRMGIGIGGIAVTKEDILDALVIKEVLLQEAQKMGLDKEKTFMKSIELYWEQTLLKNLFTKKSKEIEGVATVYEDEITDYYDKMREKIKAEVLVLYDGEAAKKLLDYEGDIAEYAEKEREKSTLLYIIPPRVYTLGEDNSLLENAIFSVGRDKDRELVQVNGKWALIVIEERLSVEPEPLSAIREEIVKYIKMRKERELMNEWMDTLRSNACIKINKKVLSELH